MHTHTHTLRCSPEFRNKTHHMISLTVILPVALYGFKTWSFTFREEHRLSVFKWGAEGDAWY
jgi:hypothetical protein